jgi:hypothetical protein
MTNPNPGSDEALQCGCTCPVLDNHYGHGVPDGNGGVNFWYVAGCPVHAGNVS